MPRIWKFIQASCNCRLLELGASTITVQVAFGTGQWVLSRSLSSFRQIRKVVVYKGAMRSYEGNGFYCGLISISLCEQADFCRIMEKIVVGTGRSSVRFCFFFFFPSQSLTSQVFLTHRHPKHCKQGCLTFQVRREQQEQMDSSAPEAGSHANTAQ